MPMLQGLFGASGSWVRVVEHGAVRVFSFAFSMASAYAIRLFFTPLDVADPGERVITWVIAVGFGGLGYIVSRGLVHRMMHKEPVWAYAPIVFLVELVEIACNYILAASVVHQAWWLNSVPANQQGFLTFITYVVLSAVPLVSIFLAVVDMDLDRSKTVNVAMVRKPVVPPRPVVQPGAANNGAAAAKRAAYFGNRQAQQNQQGQQGSQNGARVLMNDPEKDSAGVP
jgi:hypothetical protein